MAHRFIARLIGIPRPSKRAMITASDTALVPVALAATAALEANSVSSTVFPWPIEAVAFLMALSVVLTLVMGIHRVQLKAYESHAFALTVAHGVLVAVAAAIVDGLAGYGSNASTWLTFALLYPILIGISRLVGLRLLRSFYRHGQAQVRVIIYGAGRTGRQLAAALRSDDTIVPVAFVDDDHSLHGTIVQGFTVYAPDRILRIATDRNVDRILLAIPHLARPRQAMIARRLEALGLQVQTLPSFAELAGSGRPIGDQLLRLKPDSFLGRDNVESCLPSGAETYVGRSVLVTGAGGSIGSELCRKLLACKPTRLVMMDTSELGLFEIDMELAPLCREAGVTLVPILGSVCDAAMVRRVLADNAVEIVLHAAAYKHVHMVENNPVAGVANNVLGTQVLALASLDAGVRRFILVSSDKAVRPHNLMGASKRLSEVVVQDLASRSDIDAGGTIFAMVRFGNVIGSSGSVIPLFQEQINRGGPVTLTDRDVTRYFMTIPEAARLVLVAGTFARGGDLFVLDMGDPVLIHDLANQMIRAAGLTVKDHANPDGDIEIVLTGLRPGEKLHEELLIGADQTPTSHPKIMRAREVGLSEIEVAACLKGIRQAAADADPVAMRNVVARWVEGGQRLVERRPQAKGFALVRHGAESMPPAFSPEQ